MVYEDSLPSNFECFVELPREKCAAIQGRIVKKEDELFCFLCKRRITTLSDIDEGGESDGDPYSPSGDGDGDGDGTGESIYDSGDELEPDDSPEETMREDVRIIFFELRGHLQDLDDDRSHSYSHYITQHYEALTSLYMALSHHGLRFWEANTGRRAERAAIVLCVHMLQERQAIDYYILLELKGIQIQRARLEIRRILAFLRGEGVDEITDYMRVYASALGYSNILDQAIKWWESLSKPRLADPPEAQAVIWLAESAQKLQGKKYTIQKLAALTRIGRSTLSRVQKALSPTFATLIL